MTPTGFNLSPQEVPILGVRCLSGLTGIDTSVSSECLPACGDGDSTLGKSCRPFVPSLLLGRRRYFRDNRVTVRAVNGFKQHILN